MSKRAKRATSGTGNNKKNPVYTDTLRTLALLNTLFVQSCAVLEELRRKLGAEQTLNAAAIREH